jgi:hypothetical protein
MIGLRPVLRGAVAGLGACARAPSPLCVGETLTDRRARMRADGIPLIDLALVLLAIAVATRMADTAGVALLVLVAGVALLRAPPRR